MRSRLSRRDFLKISGAAGGGLLVAIYLEGCKPAGDLISTPTLVLEGQEATATQRSSFIWEPSIYIKLDQDGIMTFTAFRSEMGQGIRTALALLAADEMDIPWSSVRIIQADADPAYGNQMTGGSASISGHQDIMRLAGAKTRQLLVEAAAQIWGVDYKGCTTDTGYVIHPDGAQKLSYGELAEPASKVKMMGRVKTKEPEAFDLIGKGMGHWDAQKIITGKAVFGLDMRLPGMLFAAIARCPVFDGTVATYDDVDARKVNGVKDVVLLGDRLAVVAQNSWAAIQGRNALKIAWDEGDNKSINSDEMMDKAAGRIKKSDKENILDAYYEIPYEAHATMEPMNCTANFHDGSCEVWAPTQSPQDVQNAIARVCGISTDKVTVHLPLIGGGFGRRLQTDYAEEAALLSKTIAAPVLVFWTRDDDLQHDFYHPMSVQYAFVSLSKPSIPAIRVENGTSIPTGAWRSVDQFTRAYSEQSFIDEMALALGKDPLEMRRELYANNDRALGVITLAAEKADWGNPLPTGQGRGMAYFATFGVTHVAEVVELTVGDDSRVRVN